MMQQYMEELEQVNEQFISPIHAKLTFHSNRNRSIQLNSLNG